MKKTFKLIVTMRSIAITVLVAVIGFSIIACSNGTTGGGGGGGGGNTGGGRNGVAIFDLTGAKAVLATGSGGQTSASGRAVARAVTENGLLKLLDNDSVVSVFSRNQDMAWIGSMCGSPAETGRKDLYIQFGHSWTYKTDDGESVRIDNLIHVREDGTVVNVSDDIGLDLFNVADFDRKGNVYFINDESSTSGSSIFKYDPVTGKKETLLGNDGSFYLKHVSSYDGSFLLVEGVTSDRTKSIIKLIPCDNPGQAFDIFDITDKGFSAFAVSRTKREVYLSFNRGHNDDDRGLYKLSSVNGGISKDDWELTTLIEDVGSSVIELYIAPDNSVWGHCWNDSAGGFVNGFVKLIDRNEQPANSFSIVNIGSFLGVKLSASHIYFVVPDDSYKSHKISRFSYDNPGNVENLFDKIDFKGRDKDDISVGGFYVAGDFLYLPGTEGVIIESRIESRNDGDYIVDYIVGGDDFIAKINLTTFEYTEITWEEQACTAIVGW